MDKQFFIVSLKDIFSLVTLLLKLLFPLLLRTVSGLIPLIVFKTAGGCVVGVHTLQVSTAFFSLSLFFGKWLSVGTQTVFLACHNRDTEIDVAFNIIYKIYIKMPD